MAGLELEQLRRWADDDDPVIRRSTWPFVPELLDLIESMRQARHHEHIDGGGYSSCCSCLRPWPCEEGD